MHGAQSRAATARGRIAEIIAAARAWSADPAKSEEEREAFAQYTQNLTIMLWPWFGLGIAGAALFWWPVDHLVFADSPHTREVYTLFRSMLIVLDLSMVLMLPRLSLCRRWPQTTAAVAATLNLAITGAMLAEAGQGSVLWISYAFVAPQLGTLLFVPLPMRALATSIFCVAIFGAWLAHPMGSLHSPGALPALSYLGFCCLHGVGVGHVIFVLLRRSFHLQRSLAAERADLEKLATRLEHRVTEQTRALRVANHRAQDVRSTQRAELARDLHDGLGQELTSLRLLIGVGRATMSGPGEPELLSELSDSVQRVQQSLRRVLVSLRPALLDEQGLVEALRTLVRELERRSSLEIKLEISDTLPEPIPADQGVALYHIAQEGLHNALRHARANRITLGLDRRDQALVLTVHDDGVGIAPVQVGAGMGTRGVTERVEPLGGSARWERRDGTLLTVTLPLPEPT